MSIIELRLPWFLIAITILWAMVGLAFLSIKFWDGIRFLFFLLRGGFFPPKEEKLNPEETLSHLDEEAQSLLQARIHEVWYSFSPVQWLDLHVLREDCYNLVQRIAQVYFPASKQPELEVTMLELLQFNERTAHRIRDLLQEFPTFHRMTIANILDAKSLLEKTKQTIESKGVKTGRRIASRILTAINAINPNYWIQRFLFRGASEVIGRKVLTSIYRIVGVEAIRLYRASAQQITHKSLQEEELIDPEALIEELSEEQKCQKEEKPEETTGEARKEAFQEATAQAKTTEETKEHKKEMSEEPELIFPEDEGKEAEKESDNEGEKLKSSITRMMSAFVEGSLNLWDKMVSVDKVVSEFQKRGGEVQCLSDIESLPVEINDKVADSYIRKGRWVTAAEGAATGFGGFLLLGADAVSLLALQLRTIQQIGYCYGFDVSRPEEKLFAAKLLAEAYNHPAGKEKDAIKQEMRMAAGMLGGKTPFGLLQKRLFVQGFSKIAQKIGVRFGSRKAAQFVPVLGSAVGGLVNQQVTKDIANTAKEVYRERFLEKNRHTS